MQFLSLICFWLFILLVFWLKKDLRAVWTLKNMLIAIITGILTVIIFKSAPLYVTALSLCPKIYLPFFDEMSMMFVFATREEVIKGIMTAVLLIILKLFNPRISMRWVAVIVPCYIGTLFSWHEALGYFTILTIQNGNSTFWARALLPLHLVFQTPMAYILFYHLQGKGIISRFFVFCGSIIVAIVIHFLWNTCVTLDNDVCYYMIANTHFNTLFYVSNIIKTICCAFILIWVACMWLKIFAQSTNDIFRKPFLVSVNNRITRILKHRASILPGLSTALVALFIAFGLHQYDLQKIKPLAIVEPLSYRGGKLMIKLHRSQEEVELSSHPLVQAIDRGTVTAHKPYNHELFPKYSYHNNNPYSIFFRGFKQYLLYKNVVIGYYPENDMKERNYKAVQKSSPLLSGLHLI